MRLMKSFDVMGRINNALSSGSFPFRAVLLLWLVLSAAAQTAIAAEPATFVRPKTTRRYLHPVLSERVAVYFREGKITLGENIHSDDWQSMYYCDGKQPAHGVWLVHGEDDRSFDFRQAALSRDPEGIPVHGQTWREGDLEATLTACSPFGRLSTVHARLELVNRGSAPLVEKIGFMLRAAPGTKLVFGAPDIYEIYAPVVDSWRKLPSTFAAGADGVLRQGDRFVAFDAASEWDAKRGVARFSVGLAPGERRTISFTVGKGEIVRPDFSAAEASVRADWAKLLARARGRTPFVRNQLVQILQCLGRVKGGDMALPRQGGLERFVWPGEVIHCVEALDRLGYGEYSAMAIDFIFHFAKPDGKIGPFGNDWASLTGYSVETLAGHCLRTGDETLWRRHREAALRGFDWIVATRKETAAGGEGIVPGLFPPLKSTDYANRFQNWGMTDLVNEHALKVLAEAAEHFGEPRAAEVRAEWKAYRATIEGVLENWRKASAGKDTFFIPLTPDGRGDAKLRADHYFYIHPGAFAEGGYLSEDEMLRLRRWLIREEIADPCGLYQRHVSPRPELGREVWYTTWCERQFSRGWLGVGRKDLARQALDALLDYSVTDEGYVGERIHEKNPWFFPWSPNASGSGRILNMLLDLGLADGPETVTIDLLPGEYWWGGTVAGGWRMPVGTKGRETLDLRVSSDGNQAAPLLLSTKGRWVWCEDAFKYTIADGRLTVETGPAPVSPAAPAIPNLAKTCYSKRTFAPIETGRSGESLRTAFEHCSKTYFPPKGMCSPVWFRAPMLNTWVELNYNQNEKDILAYAKAFKDNGLADGGIFQIDCFWQTDSFGLWKFHGDRFDDPKGMVKKLNAMGFHVILWYAPFVTMDQMPYRYLRRGDGILKDARLIPYDGGHQGLPVQWWDGCSAVWDPTSPFGREWNRKTMRRIMDEYGVEGFFFDGGGPHEYPPGDYIAHDHAAQPTDLCRGFQMMATEVPLGQCREAWKMGGLPVMQTLRDKAPRWSEMRRCITDMIAAGQLGYPFTVADLIGGGTCGNSGTGVHGLDWQSELFIRHMQIECLSPIMMFSGSPWRLFDAKTQEIVRQTLRLRDRFVPKILNLAEETGRTGLPMLRSMDFEFPGCGYELVLDQFMMGDDLLVAPVVEGGAKTRKVVIPAGRWKGDDGSVITGPRTIEVATPIERLPYWEKM